MNVVVTEVFQTNLQTRVEAEHLKRELLLYYPSYRICFDLEDCDKILKISATNVNALEVVRISLKCGYRVSALE
jgi:predicted acylesterase/phospholipase RssA